MKGVLKERAVNVVVDIGGRAAIPIRAIPLLTNWETMSPDVVAMALAWDEHFYQFQGLRAYRVESGAAGAEIDATWWENYPCRKLKALSEQIKATQISHEVGYDEWRSKSLPVLPDSVFVWKDEFEERYDHKYGPNGTTFLLPSGGGQMPPAEQARRVKLNFAPFVYDAAVRHCVMQGFESFGCGTDTEPMQVLQPTSIESTNGSSTAPRHDTLPILTIHLPVGAKTVPVADIPTLIAVAKYPRMREAGWLPEGAVVLPDDEVMHVRNVSLYRLEREHLAELRHALGSAIEGKNGGLPAYSSLDGRRCASLDQASDCYVEIDEFEAFIARLFHGRMCVRIGDDLEAASVSAIASTEAAVGTPNARVPTKMPKSGDSPARTTGPRLSLVRAALIANHEHEWPTIQRDLKDACSNGLATAAKAGLRDWWEDEAIEWAKAKNKLVKPQGSETADNLLRRLPVTRHRMPR